jgi:hypothetical protein
MDTSADQGGDRETAEHYAVPHAHEYDEMLAEVPLEQLMT